MEMVVANYDSDSSEDDVCTDVGSKGEAGSTRGVQKAARPVADVESDAGPAAKKFRCHRGDLAGEKMLPVPEIAGKPYREIAIDGRVRSFPHVEGNYAGFVYVPMRNVEGMEAAAVNAMKLAAPILNRHRKLFQATSNEILLHRIPAQDLHLSVSKTFAVRRKQIGPLVNLLRRNINALPCFDAAVSGFDLSSNDDNTRSFVGLSLSVGATRMQVTTRTVDRSLAVFSLAPFYEEMRFHVSVAWFVGPLPPGVATRFSADQVRERCEGQGSDKSRGSTGLERADAGDGHGEEAKTAGYLNKMTGTDEFPRVCFSVQALEAKIGAKKYTLVLKDS